MGDRNNEYYDHQKIVQISRNIERQFNNANDDAEFLDSNDLLDIMDQNDDSENNSSVDDYSDNISDIKIRNNKLRGFTASNDR